MTEIVAAEYNESFNLHAHNAHGSDGGYVDANGVERNYSESSGWAFDSGDPELHRYSDLLVKKGGNVLDIGIGSGRNSLFFALNGMEVDGVDTNTSALNKLTGMAGYLNQYLPCRINTQVADMMSLDYEKDKYDLAILSNIIHVDSKEAAYRLFNNVYDAVKPNGFLWIRVASKLDSEYWDLKQASEYNRTVQIKDRDVIISPCGCTGTMQMDPTLFFDPMEVHVYLFDKGALIIHSEQLPETGERNIMYGEDCNRHHPLEIDRQVGMISILAQKTEA